MLKFKVSIEGFYHDPSGNLLSICKILASTLRFMGIIVLIACLHAGAGTNTHARLCILMRSSSLEKVFAEIGKQSAYTVFYNTEVLKYTGLITIDIEDAIIEGVLHFCLRELSLEYTIQDKTIFVKHNNRVAVMDQPRGSEPSPTVSGLIHSASGWPLIGATVYIRKFKKPAVTNEKGQFTLKGVPDREYDLEISFVDQ